MRYVNMEEAEILKIRKEGRTACSMFGCMNNKTNRPELSFHRLPSVRDLKIHNEEEHRISVDRRNAWLAKINRRNLSVAQLHPKKSTLRVCSDHFSQGKPATLFDRFNVPHST